jgi:maltooligosyltrehalose trehalohydrolase
MQGSQLDRSLAVGAEVLPEQGVHFRLWAPPRCQVEVVLEGKHTGLASAHRLSAEADGYFAGLVAEARCGALYRFRFDGDSPLYPDPASRFQPQGPHGPSQVIDPRQFPWTDQVWNGLNPEGQVLYELHIGTFTREGTWAAAAHELPALEDLGITAIEVMPVADFPGRFGWGYDGVDLFAPTRLYGTPDDFRRFVDQAHALGLGVLLDVVYNHLGPDGNYLKAFSPNYFTDRYKNEWGEAINFDGPNSGPVREFFLANAGYWIDEFHLDGLRLDATQQIFDESPDHILAAIAQRVREAARGRGTLLIAENEPQHVKLVRPPDQGGSGLTMLWNDDFHHSAQVVLSGHNEAYYSDYRGSPQEFISAAKWGYLYQGQRYRWQKKRRGTPTYGVPSSAFINFIENHDQVANSARGLRSPRLSSPGRYRAMSALLLLMPGTPMLFQGQEFAASSPFLFFADHKNELAKFVRKGRAQFLSQFRSIAMPEIQASLPDPADFATFERCKLDHSERERYAEVYALYRDLLKLRREDRVFHVHERRQLDGAVLGPEAFVLRYFGDVGDDRLLLVNFGTDLHLDPAPEPLLAPPEGKRWEVVWSSEDWRYGGCCTVPPDAEENWCAPGHAALVLRPQVQKTNAREGGAISASC